MKLYYTKSIDVSLIVQQLTTLTNGSQRCVRCIGIGAPRAVFYFVVQKCSCVNHLIRLCPETIGGGGGGGGRWVGSSRPQINSGEKGKKGKKSYKQATKPSGA